MANFDLANLALKATCPSNKIILDNQGLPSVMVRIPKFKMSDVLKGGSDSTHPAFIINGKEVDEIYISKYQNIKHDGRAYSLPGEDPANYITFDQAREACAAKGKGWHLMTNAEWAAIALWCNKHGLAPKGNNNYGKDYREDGYQAIPADSDSDGVRRVLTGTGPETWSHNGQRDGIWDLNGNVWEWVGGFRLVKGEIQVLKDNDAADTTNSQSESSTCWKAIDKNGKYVEPGSKDTLKIDIPNGGSIKLSTTISRENGDSDWPSQQFKDITTEDGLSVPEIVKALLIYPEEGYDGDGRFYARNSDSERVASRGGDRYDGSDAGVSSASMNRGRTSSGWNLGFRSAFVKL